MKTCMDPCADFVQWGSNGGGEVFRTPIQTSFKNSHGTVAKYRPPTSPPWKFCWIWICLWIYDLEFVRFIEAHNYFKHIKNH